MTLLLMLQGFLNRRFGAVVVQRVGIRRRHRSLHRHGVCVELPHHLSDSDDDADNSVV